MAGDLQLNDPQTLYRRWEESQWSPFAIDLSRDAEQWRGLDDGMRGLLPAIADALRPPGDGAARVLGASEDDLRAFALDGMTRRLAIIGVPIESLHL